MTLHDTPGRTDPACTVSALHSSTSTACLLLLALHQCNDASTETASCHRGSDTPSIPKIYMYAPVTGVVGLNNNASHLLTDMSAASQGFRAWLCAVPVCLPARQLCGLSPTSTAVAANLHMIAYRKHAHLGTNKSGTWEHTARHGMTQLPVNSLPAATLPQRACIDPNKEEFKISKSACACTRV